MMRWNSTKTYTEDDILRMQQEAVSRVHDFQSRAQAFYDVPESAITQYDSAGAALYTQAPVIEAQSREVEHEAPNAAPEQPAQQQGGTEQPGMSGGSVDLSGQYSQQSGAAQSDMAFTGQQANPPSQAGMNSAAMMGQGMPMPSQNMPMPSQSMPAQTPPKPTDAIKGLLEHFNLDSETLLILGLMFLLYNEKADNVLLMALGYLLL